MAARQAALGRLDEAVQSSDRAAAVCRKLVFRHPAVPALKADLYRVLAQLSHYQQQLGNATAAGRASRAARQLLENLPRKTPTEQFELALVYAELSQPRDRSVDWPHLHGADDSEYADLAVQTLQEAIEAGYRNRQAVQTAESLAALRGRDDFQELLLRLDNELQAEQGASDEPTWSARGQVGRRRTADVLGELVGNDTPDLRRRKTLAATLNAVGEIQAGLKQYDAAEQSLLATLEIRRELLDDQPDDPHTALDLGAAHIALGDVLWKSARFPAARSEWESGLELLDDALSLDPEDEDLKAEIANHELTIFRRYGEAGLWAWAAEYCERILRRGNTYDGHWDPRIGHVLAALGRFNEHAQLCQLLAENWSDTNPDMVLWAAAMNPREVFDPATLVELAERSIESKGSKGDATFRAASAFFRAGQHEKALQLMSDTQPRDFIGPHYRYWYARVDHKLGDAEQAKHMLQQGEIAYHDIALRCLQGSAITGVLDGHYGYWHAWAEDQAIRRLAWNEIQGCDPPADPWQHLIQARGYRLIGENQQADAELAAAVAAAPDDPEIWLARIRLRLEAGDPIPPVEADWAKVVALAADDPMPWIRRGRWYAEQGEHEQADADFSQAAALTPNELDRFLQAGWWVAGPLSSDWEPNSAPNLEPDPAQPLPSTGPEEGKNALAWQSLQPDGMGRLQFPDQLAERGTSSVLLMTYVYSSDQRIATLRSNNRADYQVWINGEPTPTVEPSISGGGIGRNFFFTPMSLQPGRNTILVIVNATSGQSQLDFRLDDHPLERAFDLARYGLLDDAAEVIVDRFDASLRGRLELADVQVPGCPSQTFGCRHADCS
jgi:tetratricopeptide (TPR) repeat protein